MPIIRSAIKKMHRDEKRRAHNKSIRSMLKTLVSKAEKSLSETNAQAAISALDKAAKRNIIHRNAANRKKSVLMKKLSKPEQETKVEAKKTKKPVKDKK
ncbi:MAG: 30S ribosomal protein S20 [Patescibacteria group bacterium]|nr:30S ribosomal protein S20 [Patescibacteria group bacterium]